MKSDMRSQRRWTWKRATGLGGVLTLAAGAFVAGKSYAAGIPSSAPLTYGGSLQDADGAPLTGTRNIEVRFWNADKKGETLCSSGEQENVPLTLGRFSVPLPDECTKAVQENPNVYVEIVVDQVSLGRAKVGAVPYAVEAGHAASAETAAIAAEANAASGALRTTLNAKADAADVPVMTEWKSFDPAKPGEEVVRFDNGSVPPFDHTQPYKNEGRWRRVGDSMEVQVTTLFSPALGEVIHWRLPRVDGVAKSVDVAKIARGANVGGGHLWNGSVHVVSCFVSPNVAVACVPTGGGWVGKDPGVTHLEIRFTVPVVGWTATSP